MSSLPATLAVLGASVAFGVTYFNLRASRYRDELYKRIVDSIKSRVDGNSGQLSKEPSYSDLLREDDDFVEAHRTINQWVGELPGTYSSNPDVRGLFGAVAKPKPLPKVYRWFRFGYDKKVVIVGSTGVSLAVLILLGAGVPVPTGLALACAVCGVVLIVSHVWLGSRLVATYGSEFDQALEAILVALGERKADSDSKAVSELSKRSLRQGDGHDGA